MMFSPKRLLLLTLLALCLALSALPRFTSLPGAFERPETMPRTPSPDPETLALIRGPIRGEIAEVYPRFAATAFAPRG